MFRNKHVGKQLIVVIMCLVVIPVQGEKKIIDCLDTIHFGFFNLNSIILTLVISSWFLKVHNKKGIVSISQTNSIETKDCIMIQF
jgi:hypothetical protein